jgi:hypothetical protein
VKGKFVAEEKKRAKFLLALKARTDGDFLTRTA